MSKQEEIREEIWQILRASGLHVVKADEALETIWATLRSEGVVIKVDRELPKKCQDCAIYRQYSTGVKELRKAGYVAVEPLI